MRISHVLFASIILLASGFFQPALAQSKKELAAQNQQLALRLTTLENRMLTGDPAAERLMQRMDALETSQRTLTGEVERLRFERDNLQEEVRALAAALASMQASTEDMRRHLEAVNIVAQSPRSSTRTLSQGEDVYGGGRMGGMYSNGSSIPGPPTILQGGAPVPQTPAGNDISQLAEIGIEKMQEGDFADAQIAFKQYLEMNADAPDRGDIYYWLGETYYIKGGYADAADAYIASMRAAPKGDYAPEAMIRLASTAFALGQKEMACQTLASFPTQYPKAPEHVRRKAKLETQRSGC